MQRLVENGIPLETENKENETACDCAEKNGHSDIALFLESNMVFSLVCLLYNLCNMITFNVKKISQRLCESCFLGQFLLYSCLFRCPHRCHMDKRMSHFL